MNTEDSEFERIEAEAKRRAQAAEDDDTQVYAKPWVGLTDAEIWSAVDRIGTSDSDVNPYQILNNARAIEAALRSKNT